MNAKQIIEYLDCAESIDDFINPFIESGQSLVTHAVDELNRIQGLEKLIVNFSVRIAELESALITQRNKTEQSFAAGVRHAHKRKAQEKCNHSNFVKTEHLTGEGAMEYVEWFDNVCSDCGEHWTTNN